MLKFSFKVGLFAATVLVTWSSLSLIRDARSRYGLGDPRKAETATFTELRREIFTTTRKGSSKLRALLNDPSEK